MKLTFGHGQKPEDETVFATSDVQLAEEAKALTGEQSLAVDQPLAQSVLVVAGAGTGKTRCLTARIAKALRSGVEAKDLLAITFTNRAAREMQRRIQNMLPESHPVPWIGTYHACAATLLRKIPRHLHPQDFPEMFHIIDENERLQLMIQASTKLCPEGSHARLDKAEASELLQQLSQSHHMGQPGPKTFCAAKRAEKATLDLSNRGKPPFYQRGQADLIEAFEEEKRQSEVLDYDDLIRWAVFFGEEEPDCFPRYRMIAVDEFQDTDAMQNRFLKALSGQGRTPVFAVGDEDQSIYVLRASMKSAHAVWALGRRPAWLFVRWV